MRNELKVEFWKAKGVPHLNLVHQKTGMTDALTKYAEACKKPLDLAGKRARQEALKNLKAKLHKLKTGYPEQRHPKLWANYIKPVNAALPQEVRDYNHAIEKLGEALGKDGLTPDQFRATMNMMVSGFSIGSAFVEHAKKEFSAENLLFLTSMAVKKDPRWIATTFIPERAPQQINISSGTRQQVWAAVNAAPTHAALMPAFKEVARLLSNDTFRRFKHNFELQLT
jgi:Regulator of G protein signaling domain